MNKTVQAYNANAHLYGEETKEFWDNFPSSITKAFTSRLKGKSVLNVGSGPGRDALILKENGLSVTCVDASSSMVKITKELGFRTIKSDFRKMKFPNNSFDGVWAYTSLLHVPKKDVKKVLMLIHKILKKDGVLLLGMIKGKYEGNEKWSNHERYFRHYSTNELDTLVSSTGFEKIFNEDYVSGSLTFLNHIYTKKPLR